MASDEHKQLAEYVKDTHIKLRNAAGNSGSYYAWKEHCSNTHNLLRYAMCMERLATKFWDERNANKESLTTCRIKWSADLCYNYFINKDYIKYRERDLQISKILKIKLDINECYVEPLRLLDVGSCYNPFRNFSFLNVLAIDLCPANEHVKSCDFIDVQIGDNTIVEENIVKKLKQNSYDIVTFCFFLEYLPVSEMRIVACRNAYNLLKPGGLLIIITPDSKHVGANSKLIKCWQYTLACLGFTRIKYEKMRHMHCMGFRKALDMQIAVRWATLHKKPNLEFSINIPQDFQSSIETNENNEKTAAEVSNEHFKELPFYNIN
ncbi:unnamed protein product [Leptidea sinapis]|uniref:S-adenosylmethionine sensor upstream of mTORC1 n=1 Tax=Leptidea sinapis TaxID=189913 RepID=A0A5E4R069_9NEOP|nr:unnamed protein product [Leptidea sinapis]